jgi:hypothetical protein
MKLPLIYFLFLACTSQFLVAQEDSTRLKKISFRISVTDFDNQKTKGWLSKINDSSVQISSLPKHFGDTRITNATLKEIGYSQVSAIKLKRNNGAGRGAIIGAVCGFIIGAAAGFIAGDDPHVPASQDYFGIGEAFRMTATEKAIILGISGAAVMSGAGALIGTFAKKTFIIGGKKEKFDEMRINVLDKAYRNK